MIITSTRSWRRTSAATFALAMFTLPIACTSDEKALAPEDWANAWCEAELDELATSLSSDYSADLYSEEVANATDPSELSEELQGEYAIALLEYLEDLAPSALDQLTTLGAPDSDNEDVADWYDDEVEDATTLADLTEDEAAPLLDALQDDPEAKDAIDEALDLVGSDDFSDAAFNVLGLGTLFDAANSESIAGRLSESNDDELPEEMAEAFDDAKSCEIFLDGATLFEDYGDDLPEYLREILEDEFG